MSLRKLTIRDRRVDEIQVMNFDKTEVFVEEQINYKNSKTCFDRNANNDC